MKNLKTLLLSVALACSTLVVAQDLPNRGPISFEMCDSDSNGMLSRDEFDSIKEKRTNQKEEEGRLMRNANMSPAFEDVDTNKDGYISREELNNHQKMRVQEKMEEKNTNMPMGQGMRNNK